MPAPSRTLYTATASPPTSGENGERNSAIDCRAGFDLSMRVKSFTGRSTPRSP